MDRMNADVDEEWDETPKRKLDQYMDEIYELDFNDMVRIRNFYSWFTLIPLLAGGWDAHSIPVYHRTPRPLLADPRRDSNGNRWGAQSVYVCQTDGTLQE